MLIHVYNIMISFGFYDFEGLFNYHNHHKLENMIFLVNFFVASHYYIP
jgi:hypothetical protein